MTEQDASLRDACLREALAIIERDGLETLSIRAVARRLGVSHQAPYKHFASRDHLVAGVLAEAFDAFAAHLDARAGGDDPRDALRAMGRACVDYARAHPLRYRLMYQAPPPEAARDPALTAHARHAFTRLRDAVRRMHALRGAAIDDAAVEHDAMFAWSAVHGLSVTLISPIWQDAPMALDGDAAATDAMIEAALDKICAAFAQAD